MTIKSFEVQGEIQTQIVNSEEITNPLGVAITSDRGTLLLGNQPEFIGGPSHYHVMKDNNSGVDLFFGDDYNYVLQRGSYGPSGGYGVEIGANDMNEGDQQSWRFGTDGDLALPANGGIVSTTATSITTGSNPNNGPFVGMVSANLEGNGIVVFGPAGGTSEPDQLTGVDLNRLVGGTITQSGSGLSSPILGVTSLGNKLYSIQVEGALATVTGGEGIGLTITVDPLFAQTWTFGTDGALTLPSGNTTIGNLFGSDGIISAPNTGFGVLSQGSTGFGGLQWLDTVVEPLNVAGIAVNSPYAASTGSVQIYTGVVGIPHQNAWTFDPDGALTLPGTVVNSTVAKTGGNSNPQGNVLTATLSPTTGPWPNGTYFVASGGVEINTTVLTGVITLNSVSSTAGTYRVGDTIIYDGSLFGGQSITDDVTLTVVTITTAATITAIDLSKSINKLTSGAYSLADGVEGQTLHLVRQTGSVYNAITVNVVNARIDGVLNTTIDYYPFDGNAISLNMSTLIFTDGAWQSSNGSWD